MASAASPTAPASRTDARPAATAPRHRSRATRDAGRRTRSALLDAAADLFAARGLSGVSLAEIAAAADAFPSQVTYYFGSKEALFVEAACRAVLHTGAHVEEAGTHAWTRQEYARVLAETALRAPALRLFAEALLVARQRPDLAGLVEPTLARLHVEGARAVERRCAEAGWPLEAPAEAVARGFWATVLGLVLERGAAGDAVDTVAAEAAVLAALHVRPPSPDRGLRRRAGSGMPRRTAPPPPRRS